MAKVRWSNGGERDDAKPDVHGMAVKVLGVTGMPALEGSDRRGTGFHPDRQRGLLRPGREDNARADDRARGLRARSRTRCRNSLRSTGHCRRVAAARKTIASPLTARYWSTVPFKLGGGAVKYSVVPSIDNKSGEVPATSSDYLRAAMASQLAPGENGVRFELCLIPQSDPATIPLRTPWCRGSRSRSRLPRSSSHRRPSTRPSA